MSTLSEMGCDMSFTCKTRETKRRIGISFSINPYLHCIMWKYISRASINVLWQINMRYITCNGQECTWRALFQMLFFRRYLNWCRWKQRNLRSMLPPLTLFFPITMMIWRRLWITWIVSNSKVIWGKMRQIAVIQSC